MIVFTPDWDGDNDLLLNPVTDADLICISALHRKLWSRWCTCSSITTSTWRDMENRKGALAWRYFHSECVFSVRKSRLVWKVVLEACDPLRQRIILRLGMKARWCSVGACKGKWCRACFANAWVGTSFANLPHRAEYFPLFFKPQLQHHGRITGCLLGIRFWWSRWCKEGAEQL